MKLVKINAFSDAENYILNTLLDNNFHSGEDLSKALNLSRTTISNLVKKLENNGLEIAKIPRRGYKLIYKTQRLKVDSESFNEINPFIDTFYFFEKIDSTNDFLLANSTFDGHAIAYSEYQTLGKGRRGKEFLNSYGQHLMFSFGTHFGEVSAIAGLSIAIGICVIRALKNLGFNPQIKWPNDIYINGKKVCGILVESSVSKKGAWVVMGVGLNVGLTLSENEKFSKLENIVDSLENVSRNQNSTDLKTNKDINLSQNLVDKTKLFTSIIKEINQGISIFKNDGLNPFLEEYKEYDLFYGKEVYLINDALKIEGINQGITSTGSLIVKTKEGTKHILCGEMSLREITH